MARTHTAGGNIERGYGQQRQFVRAVERLDGVTVVCAYASGGVSLSTTTESLDELDRLAHEHGSEVELAYTGSPKTYTYDCDGSLSVRADFEHGPNY